MSLLNLNEQLASLLDRVRRELESIDDADTIKPWFAGELAAITPRPGELASLEEASARMRVARQLAHMIATHPRRKGAEESEFFHDPHGESIGTLGARVPAVLFDTVKRTNFSIEPAVLLAAPAGVEAFDAVSPTAKVVGYLRCRDASLAFAHHLAFATEARQTLEELGIVDPRVRANMSALFCARYHAINTLVARRQARQVLEIASGISPRGLQWSRENPGTVYIESDLPALIRHKAKILRNAIDDDPVAERGILHCCGIDALDLASIRHALEYTDPNADLVVVSEGLLLYFTADEMRRFLLHMRALLAERPRAAWVVDLVSQSHLRDLFARHADVAQAIRTVFAATGREVVGNNPFQTDACIERWLGEHGLEVVETRTLAETLDELGEQGHAWDAEAKSIVGERKIWTIRAARS